MRTAREIAHEHVEWACDLEREESGNTDAHSEYCDNLTAAIEARDAEYAALLAEKTEAAGKLANDYLANMNFRAHVSVELSDLTSERDRLRSALQVAREALERLQELPCQTCRRDADARAALKAIIAAMTTVKP